LISAGLFPASRDIRSSFSCGDRLRHHVFACFSILTSFANSQPIPIFSSMCFPHFMQQYRQTGLSFAGHVLISQAGYERRQW
jgi:hypothetical protein